MKIAAVGFTCIDIYENLNNKKYATGNGVDVLINLRQMAGDFFEGSVVSAIGKDENGILMKETLKNYNINIKYLFEDDSQPTAVIKMSLNGLERVHGERIYGVMKNYTLQKRDMDFISQQDIIHTDLSWKVVPRLPEIIKNGTKVFFDFSIRYNWPEVKEILPYITWGLFSFPNYNDEVKEFLKNSFRRKNKLLIATFGEEGALAYDGEKFYRQDSVQVEKIINTVGAGDSFAAGFLYGQIMGKDIQESLYLGAKRASEIIGKFNPY